MPFQTHTTVRQRPWRTAIAAACLTFAGSAAMAQGVTLTCPTPTATGVTANLSTAATVWETQAPGASTWSGAATASNTNWLGVPGAAWIGDGVSGAFGDWKYRLQITANDPNIDLASASVTFNYRADNEMLSASLAGTPLPVLPSVTFNTTPLPAPQPATSTPLAAGINDLMVIANNAGSTNNPYGLIMQATLTYNCRIAPTAAATAVPVDAPWALAGMGALLAASVAMSKRRRKPA